MTTLSVYDAIEQRRAVKSYDPGHKLSDDEFNQLMQYAILSPTAFNIQNWRFVRIIDPELRQAIRQVAWDQAQVTDASELLILCFDSKAWQKQPQRYWQHAPQAVQDFLLPAINQYYENREQVQRDEGMRSCGIAAMNIMLQAKAMGYDSCPMDGFDYAAVAKLINLPADHEIAMMVVIGKKTKVPWPRPGQLSVNEVLITNRF